MRDLLARSASEKTVTPAVRVFFYGRTRASRAQRPLGLRSEG